MIKRNRTWKIRSLPGYSLASRCTTDRLHVSLRTATFCHGVLRSARFITAHYVSHFHRDCRGRFLNCQKICHGVHGYPGVLRLPIPFPCVASRLSRFAHGCLKRGCRDRREHSVNAVSYCVYTMFPAAPFARNVACRGVLVIHFSDFQDLLRFVTPAYHYHGLLRIS